MYSEGSEFLPQNNETALQYFKKASDLVRMKPDTNVFSICCCIYHSVVSIILEEETPVTSGDEQDSVAVPLR